MLVHLDLFSGIGGFTLACQWAGIETIGFVEIDKYCQKVLRNHWPDVPIVEDIRDVERSKEIVANTQCSIRTRQAEGETHRQGKGGNGSRARLLQTTNQATTAESPAILITAGFPCQPFSVAGKQLSQGDDRYLWPQTLAVIKAIKPQWVLLENVTGIINLALDQVLSDLEGAGYSYETLVIPACAVNAWHRRDRIWIVANTGHTLWGPGTPSGCQAGGQYLATGQWAESPAETAQCGQDVASPQTRESGEQTEPEGRQGSSRGRQEVAIADTQRARLEGADTEGYSCAAGQPMQPSVVANSPECNVRGTEIYGWGETRQGKVEGNSRGRRRQTDGLWAVEPELGRVAHGIPNRVDRLKCLGNAIVPQVAYEIIKVIAEIEAKITAHFASSEQ